jgi:hypothetical protein
VTHFSTAHYTTHMLTTGNANHTVCQSSSVMLQVEHHMYTTISVPHSLDRQRSVACRSPVAAAAGGAAYAVVTSGAAVPLCCPLCHCLYAYLYHCYLCCYPNLHGCRVHLPPRGSEDPPCHGGHGESHGEGGCSVHMI